MAADLVPVVQLFHVTDVHIGPDSVRGASLRTYLLHLGLSHLPVWRHGTAGHDPSAREALEESIGEVLGVSTQFGPDQSWLVSTGDLSTWGDDASLDEGLAWLRDIAVRRQIRCTIATYGNHDVWSGVPGQHPLWSTPDGLTRHRAQLRARQFPETWPLIPLKDGAGQSLAWALPASGGRLLACSLNNVVHERASAVLAVGHVGEDRYWEACPPIDQLRQFRTAWVSGDIGIVLTHHPVFDPHPPLIGMVLLNHESVADSLRNRARIVLSGHTHALFPALGALPEVGPLGPACHTPLGEGQVQLIGGTLAQREVVRAKRHRGSRKPRRGPEHTWQLLRIWQDSETTNIVLERIAYRRTNRTGAFRPERPAGAGPDDYSEVLVLGS